MWLRLKYVVISAIITVLAIMLVVLAFHFFSGGRSLYDAGGILLVTGLALSVITMPLFYRSHHRARIRIHLHLSVDERNKIVPDPYYDVFAGVAFATLLSAALGYGLVRLGSVLESRESSNATLPFVESVRAVVPGLYDEAHQWQSDAYLTRLVYNFGLQEEGYSSNYLIRASFNSQLESSHYLMIEITPYGEFISKVHSSSGAWGSRDDLAEDNWSIDSPEAVTIFAQDEGIRACLTLNLHKELTLMSLDSTAMWCLEIDECTALERRVCINAVSGEFH